MGLLSRLNPVRRGSGRAVVEGVAYGVAGYGFGYVQNRYRGKASVAGVPLDLTVGVLGKVLSMTQLFTGRWGGRVHAASNFLGNVGLAAFGHTLGAGHGAEKAGIARLLIQKSDVAKAKAAIPGAEILGVEKAPHGKYLTPSQLADIARG